MYVHACRRWRNAYHCHNPVIVISQSTEASLDSLCITGRHSWSLTRLQGGWWTHRHFRVVLKQRSFSLLRNCALHTPHQFFCFFFGRTCTMAPPKYYRLFSKYRLLSQEDLKGDDNEKNQSLFTLQPRSSKIFIQVFPWLLCLLFASLYAILIYQSLRDPYHEGFGWYSTLLCILG